MLSDMIDDLVRADCQQEKDAALFRAAAQTVGKVVIFGVLALVGIAEAAYRQLEKLGVDRITADVIADERRKEARL